MLRLQSSEQTKEKEKERGGGGGALITAGIEEKRGTGPYQVKMPYTFGDEDGWFPEGDDNAHIRSK